MASFDEWRIEDVVFLEQMNALEEIAQAARVMDEWFGSGGEPVERDKSAARAEICSRCPNNVKGSGWWERSKTAAADLIRRHIETKKLLRLYTPHDDSLNTCDVCGCVLKLKVHVPLWFAIMDMPPDQRKRFKAVNCWLIQEQGKYK